MGARFKPGDCVVYRKQKYAARPARTARLVWPAPNGDQYCYCVEKFYRVVALRGEEVVVVTRRGRERAIPADDPALRHARWWERLLGKGRFPPAAAGGAAP